MANRRGPKIVAENCVFAMDPGNTRSYPGSGTTATDLVGGNTGTLTNGVGFSNNVWTFDGVDDYIDLGNVAALTPGTGEFTIEFWVNSAWSTTYEPIFTTFVSNGLWIGKLSSNFVLRGWGVADDLQYNTFPTANEWVHISITRVGTTATIYYDATSVVSGTVTRNYVQGTSEIGKDGQSEEFTGKISSVKYYNRGLSADEVLQNYNATKHRYGVK